MKGGRQRLPPRAIGRDGTQGNGEFLWLVSLSDLMILLFVFFVVMFSFFYRKMGPNDFRRLTTAWRSDARPVSTPLDEIQARLLKWVVDRRLLQSVEMENKEDALILHIREKILFDSAAFTLRPEGRELMETMGEALGKIPAPYRIGIEGHTDDEPIHTAATTDNWELSAKRAHAVLVALDLSPDLLKRAVILGYAEMKPIAPNRDQDGKPIAANQAKNRRVTIRIF